MKSKTKIFTYGIIALFLMTISVLFASINNNRVSIQTSGNLELSNFKIKCGNKTIIQNVCQR